MLSVKAIVFGDLRPRVKSIAEPEFMGTSDILLRTTPSSTPKSSFPSIFPKLYYFCVPGVLSWVLSERACAQGWTEVSMATAPSGPDDYWREGRVNFGWSRSTIRANGNRNPVSILPLSTRRPASPSGCASGGDTQTVAFLVRISAALDKRLANQTRVLYYGGF